ncbi:MULTISPECIES: RHS repeat-associated core domain-containing protein [unclassified Pseudomonas]|jgi:RHS repeat-associated protein|uniref:RHS repeat-associated core domain-containing protein n=1 Tax=Pseudomonas sp. A-R-26 TaxID=2832404 RepID=UPI001CC1C1DF|nr:RHS repeat-associated core domain-containing protein [Pseudomonas sp. A-R-26]
MSALTRHLNRYRYDALDRLVELELSELEKLTRFYCGEHLVTQLKGQGGHCVLQHDRQLLAVQSFDGAECNSQLLVTNQQRSVLRMDGPGGVVRQVYAPYGHRRVESGPGSLLGFTGEAVDPATGHYLLGNGHRAFNPVLMRFNSPDRLSPFGRGGLNAYAYCLGDPVNFSDPTGRFADIARLITSLLSVTNTGLGMSRVIPSYNLAKDALRLGAVTKLPFRQSATAVSTVVASGTILTTGLVGVASAVATLVDEPETAKILGYVALGLTGLAIASRGGTYWAASKPGTEAALMRFVKNKGQPVVATPPATPRPSIASLSGSTLAQVPSAPPLRAIDETPFDWMTPEIDAALNRLGGTSPRNSMSIIRNPLAP